MRAFDSTDLDTIMDAAVLATKPTEDQENNIKIFRKFANPLAIVLIIEELKLLRTIVDD